jgi:uncharacterized protein (TIGR03066 family)
LAFTHLFTGKGLRMRILGCTLLMSAVLVLVGCGSGNKSSTVAGSLKGTAIGSKGYEATHKASYANLIVGVWEITKSKDAPPGAKMEYTKDGKLIVTVPVKGKDQTMKADYKVEGDKITVTIPGPGGKNATESATILTLNDTTLITRDKKGEVEESKRK